MNNYNYNWYYMDRDNSYNMNQPKKDNLFSPKEGFIKGNMFSNLYSEYKNYRSISFTPRNEKEKKLMELQEVSFAAHDLNLYLNTHPEDQSMFMLFQDYLRKKENLTKEYESIYGPLTVMGMINSNNFNWINNWPWEVKNV